MLEDDCYWLGVSSILPVFKSHIVSTDQPTMIPHLQLLRSTTQESSTKVLIRSANALRHGE